MNGLIGQGSNPFFLNVVWLFFLIASVLVFILGVGLVLRSSRMLRLFDLMNRWISVDTRKIQISVPQSAGSVAADRPVLFGILIVAGAAASVFILGNFDAEVFSPLFLGSVPHATAALLAKCTKWLLVIGNAICVVVGLLMLLSPAMLSRLEAVTDMWYSVRKPATPQAHDTEVDRWVLANPTVSGTALIVMSLGLASAVLSRI